MKGFENRETPLDAVFGKYISAGLVQQISKAKSTSERIQCVEQFLLDKLKNHLIIDHIIKSTIDTLLETKGGIKISSLSENDASTRRQLERRFAKLIGLSPKQLGKVIRLQTTLKPLCSGRETSLTNLADASNYYDQAHFIKEFKEFTGVTPKRFYQDDQLVLSSIIYTGNGWNYLRELPETLNEAQNERFPI